MENFAGRNSQGELRRENFAGRTLQGKLLPEEFLPAFQANS